MTAGTDLFASGIFTKFDLTCIVVEPTKKSLDVYHQYKQYVQGYTTNYVVIGNKIHSDADREYIEKNITDPLLGCVGYSEYVKQKEQGSQMVIDTLEPENKKVLETVYSHLLNQKKDWKKYFEYVKEFHIKNCHGWANSEYGKDLSVQIDEDFRYPIV